MRGVVGADASEGVYVPGIVNIELLASEADDPPLGSVGLLNGNLGIFPPNFGLGEGDRVVLASDAAEVADEEEMDVGR